MLIVFSNYFSTQLLLGDLVPDFSQDSTFGTINFHEYINGSWAVLFSHPKDFTPVCTTELSEVAKLSAEWKKRNTKVIALSVDSVSSHNEWLKDIASYGKVEVDYPIIADQDYTVSNLFSMIHPKDNNQFTVRSVFFIDSNKKLRAQITYPAAVGRNFREIIRVLDALQTADTNGIATPVNWNVGDRVIIPPSVNDEDAKKKFGEFESVKSYLRFTDINK